MTIGPVEVLLILGRGGGCGTEGHLGAFGDERRRTTARADRGSHANVRRIVAGMSHAGDGIGDASCPVVGPRAAMALACVGVGGEVIDGVFGLDFSKADDEHAGGLASVGGIGGIHPAAGYRSLGRDGLSIHDQVTVQPGLEGVSGRRAVGVEHGGDAYVDLGAFGNVVGSECGDGGKQQEDEATRDSHDWNSPLLGRVYARCPGRRSLFFLPISRTASLVGGAELAKDLALIPANAIRMCSFRANCSSIPGVRLRIRAEARWGTGSGNPAGPPRAG